MAARGLDPNLPQKLKSSSHAWVAEGNETSLAAPTVSRNGGGHVSRMDGEVDNHDRIMLADAPLEMPVLFEGED